MTFDQVLTEYNRQALIQQAAFGEWLDLSRTSKDIYPGPHIDYTEIDKMLCMAARDEFGFSDRQIGFIHAYAYERYHSAYGDMPYGMRGICQMLKEGGHYGSNDEKRRLLGV